MGKKSEYAQTGVDYKKAEPFRRVMQAVGRRTVHFPNQRNVFVDEEAIGTHGAIFEYRGSYSHSWVQTKEGLGNKNWIAEWMYQFSGTGRTYYEGIGIDVILAAGNDVIAQGALPVIFNFEVSANSYDWCEDEQRTNDLAESLYQECKVCGMAFPAGETAALQYLVNAKQPVKTAPVLSGSITGIIAPRERKITGERLRIGDHIIGVKSSGLHINGISLVIERAMELPEIFLTKLPNGNTLGKEALIPTRSYITLVEALLEAEVDIHALLPGTGSGLSKIAYDKRPFTYRIHTWIQNIPQLFLFIRELGVSLVDCLTTFNWGIGYYIFVPPYEVERTITVGKETGYELLEVGRVEEGERKIIFEPGNITLPPPGE